MESLRQPPLYIALVCLALSVAIESGAGLFPRQASAETAGQLEAFANSNAEFRNAWDQNAAAFADIAGQEQPPGMALSALGLLDSLLLFALVLQMAGLWMIQSLQVKIQGVITILVALGLLFAAIPLVFRAIAEVLLMVGLLLAIPFGTLIYLAIYGFFDVSGAAILLMIVNVLKLIAALCLPLAHQRLLERKALIALLIASLVATFVISLLHSVPPQLLVSITDGIGAIGVGVVAAIWALVLGLGAFQGLLRVLRVDQGA